MRRTPHTLYELDQVVGFSEPYVEETVAISGRHPKDTSIWVVPGHAPPTSVERTVAMRFRTFKEQGKDVKDPARYVINWFGPLWSIMKQLPSLRLDFDQYSTGDMQTLRRWQAGSFWAALNRPAALCNNPPPGYPDHLRAMPDVPYDEATAQEVASAKFQVLVNALQWQWPDEEGAPTDGLEDDYGIGFLVAEGRVDRDTYARFVQHKIYTYGNRLLEPRFRNFF